MISLFLENVDFEQDIRELFMAFFPEEGYNYDETVQTEWIFRAKTENGRIIASLECNDDALKRHPCSEQGQNHCVPVSFESLIHDSRLDTKNELKRSLYGMLSKRTGAKLPWGTLTGIRPTKIAMEKLMQGFSKSQVRVFLRQKYLLSDEKAKLCVDTAFTEKTILEKVDYENGWSLYIGIPFCPTRCAYCSFTGYPIKVWEKQQKVDEYVDVLCREIMEVSKRMHSKKLQTIYMGGGTPTSIRAKQMDRILNCIREHFDLRHLLEFTIEAGRPDSITREKLEVMTAHGVKRISINPQTMKQSTLDLIGRHHSADEVRKTFALAREAGFDNINMDIIVGLPDENLSDVEYTMQELKKLKPESVTVHSLAIKRAARLNTEKEEFSKNKVQNTWEMLHATAKACEELGLQPYYLYRQKNMAGNFENVGYSLPGKECLYNILIMEEKQTIIACGAGTSSKIIFRRGNRLERVETVKDPKLYIERIEEMMERKFKKIMEANDEN